MPQVVCVPRSLLSKLLDFLGIETKESRKREEKRMNEIRKSISDLIEQTNRNWIYSISSTALKNSVVEMPEEQEKTGETKTLSNAEYYKETKDWPREGNGYVYGVKNEVQSKYFMYMYERYKDLVEYIQKHKRTSIKPCVKSEGLIEFVEVTDSLNDMLDEAIRIFKGIKLDNESPYDTGYVVARDPRGISLVYTQEGGNAS